MVKITFVELVKITLVDVKEILFKKWAESD